MKFKSLSMVLIAAGFSLTTMTPAFAYSCNAEFQSAQELIKEAESMVKADTDSRILALIAKAKGIASAGIISHSKANQGHTGATGKFMHGNSVSMGRQAQSIATQAIFLLSGETR